MTPQASQPSAASAHIETIVSRVLRYGVSLSFLLMLIGSVLLFATGGHTVTVHLVGGQTAQDPLAIISDAAHLHANAVIALGLMLLILIPVIHVGISIFAYLAEKDHFYTGIAIFVFAVLILSLVLGATAS